MTNELVHFDRARQELALAKDIDEVKLIRDKAEALRLYIKQQGASLEMQNHCAEIKLRAERQAGEMLGEMERTEPKDTLLRGNIVKPREEPTLSDLGISKVQSHRWQVEAEVPEPEFERHVAEVRVRGEELTSKGLLDLAYQRRRIQGKQDVANVAPPNGKYRTIVIDPPWPMDKSDRTARPLQGPYLEYPTMEIDEIKSLPVPDLAAESCHVYLWTTHRFLPVAFEVFETWGVKYHCLLTWARPGPGRGCRHPHRNTADENSFPAGKSGQHEKTGTRPEPGALQPLAGRIRVGILRRKYRKVGMGPVCAAKWENGYVGIQLKAFEKVKR